MDTPDMNARHNLSLLLLCMVVSIAAAQESPSPASPAAASSPPPASPQLADESPEKPAPVSETLQPITVDSEEAAYIRRMRKLRRDRETTRMEAEIVEERLRIHEAIKKIQQGPQTADQPGPGFAPVSVLPSPAHGAAVAPQPAAPGGAADGPVAVSGGATASAASPKLAAAPLPPRVLGIVNGAANIEFRGVKNRYSPGDVFEEHRVVKISFDGVLLQMPDGSRRMFNIDWP